MRCSARLTRLTTLNNSYASTNNFRYSYTTTTATTTPVSTTATTVAATAPSANARIPVL